MRIVTSRVDRFGGGTVAAVGSARAGVHTREGLRLTLTASSGVEGLGEASPLPGYSPETLEDAAAALEDLRFELDDVCFTHDPMEAVEGALAPVSRRLDGAPSARFAVETALFDILGRTLGVAMHRLLGGARHQSLPRAALLSAPLDPIRSLEEGRRAHRRGLRVLKAKIGGPSGLDAELSVLARLREEMPPFTLRLDANGAWSAIEAREVLRRIAPLAPEYVEEPCGVEELISLGVTAVPWAADESLRGLGDALVSAPGCAAVVLKPGLLGLVGARRLAAAASRRGKTVVVSHMFDGPVALAAAAELALSLPDLVAHGLDPHPALAAFPRIPIPQLEGEGDVRASGAHGLGMVWGR